MTLISSAQLLDAVIPHRTHEVRPRDHAFYALSIGFGQDPLDLRELRFVDAVADIIVVPSVPLVLGYPGFWLGDPDLGLDAAKIVHVWQEIELHEALPTSGTVEGRTEVTGLFSRGPGRGLAVTSERAIWDRTTNLKLATLRQSHFLLGDECPEAPPLPRAPEEASAAGAPDFVLPLQTRPEQALLYRLNGDMNPLHINPEVAKSAGFPAPILHGMCSFGMVTRALVSTLCDYRVERLRKIAMRFRGAVFPGNRLEAWIWADGRFQVRVPSRDTVIIDQGFAEIA